MHDRLQNIISFVYRNYPWLLFSVLIVITLFQGEQVLSDLQYQRLAIFDGQLYRVITAHFVHTNVYHGLLNLCGLILIGVLSSNHMLPRDWWLGMSISILVVSAGLLVFNAEVQWYRGMSGVLHGIVVLLVLKARQLAGFIRVLLLLALGIKILLEQGQSGFWANEQLLGAPVITVAHLYGVVGGVVSYLALHLTRSKRMFRENF